MDIRIPMALAEKVRDSLNSEWMAERITLSPYQRYVVLDGIRVPSDVLKALRLETKDISTSYAQSISFLYAASRGNGKIRAHNMGEMVAAIVSYLKADFIKGYMFSLANNKAIVPYVVTSVESNEKELTSSYARVNARNRQKYVTVSFHHTAGDGNLQSTWMRIDAEDAIAVAKDLGYTVMEEMGKPSNKDEVAQVVDFKCPKGIAVSEFFRRAGFFKESAEYHERHKKQLDRYLRYIAKFGQQFQVRGFSESHVSRRGFWSTYNEGELMLVEGKPGRCIMDTVPAACFGTAVEDDGTHGRKTSRSYRYRDNDEDEGYEQNDAFKSVEELEIKLDELTLQHVEQVVQMKWKDDVKVVAPLHPALRIFHLAKHRFFTVHVNNLKPYEYKEDIARFLILPDEVKELAQMLVGGSNLSDTEDVIEGKSQSTVIALIGAPGVGKTLTAEVISEASKKPLYKIPADQLGGSADELERRLGRLLRRAERWNAVLMIDEANAYVHARGIDIAQNAIVGVFLRLIEYFRGTLVLTTNQTARSATSKQRQAEPVFDIDDAILNRCDAVIRLDLPSPEESKAIWQVQRELLGLEKNLSDSVIDKLVSKYTMSGRSIRKLLINAARLANYKEEKLSMDHFKTSAKFIPFTDIKESKDD